MDPRRITITIAGRSYPLSVPAAEEETLRRVGKEIEQMIKEFEASFSVRDKQDALAMCCLKFGTNADVLQQSQQRLLSASKEKVAMLSSLLDSLEK